MHLAPQSQVNSSSRRRPPPKPGARLRQQELLTLFTPVVRKIAGGFQKRLPCTVLRADLVAAGMSGLWDAIQKHGDEKTENFEWYVRVRVRGAILDELRAQDWLPRRARAAVNRAQRSDTSAQSSLPAVVRLEDVGDGEQARCLMDTTASANAEQEVLRKMEREHLERMVQLLPERERYIVSMHYFRGVKFKDLGKILGVSEPRISQLHSRAMGRMRDLMAESEAA
jgi:RNA polymerase sigma factor for flagellar operon FliA